MADEDALKVRSQLFKLLYRLVILISSKYLLYMIKFPLALDDLSTELERISISSNGTRMSNQSRDRESELRLLSSKPI